MARFLYYINNVQVDGDCFLEMNFNSDEWKMLLEGHIITKDFNEYRIYQEVTTMGRKYDNNFYRGFNKKNKNNKNAKNTKKEEKKMNNSTGRVGRPYSYAFDEEDYFCDYTKYLNFDTTKKKYYIAYGSNLNKGQMIHRCPHAVAKYTGLLRDWELFYAGSKTGNYATIRRCKGKSVPVAVWEIDGLDEYYLDAYEGYPTFYFKDTIEFMADGEKKSAMVYIMRTDAPEGKPSNHYVGVVRQGYKDFGFDEKYLDESIEKWKVEEPDLKELLMQNVFESVDQLVRRVQELGYWVYSYQDKYVFCGNNEQEYFIHIFNEDGLVFVNKVSEVEVQ